MSRAVHAAIRSLLSTGRFGQEALLCSDPSTDWRNTLHPMAQVCDPAMRR